MSATPELITTVTVAATSYDLVSAQDVLDELDLDEAKNPSLLARWIKEASSAAAKFCNRVFVAETVQDQFFPFRDWPPIVRGRVAPLQLSRSPVITLTSITEDGTLLTSGTDFLLKANVGQCVRLDSVAWPKTWPAIAIVAIYQAGFAAIPDDVIGAVIRMVKSRYLAQGRDPMLRQENVEGVYSATYWVAGAPGGTGNLPPDIQEMLEAYRVPVIG